MDKKKADHPLGAEAAALTDATRHTNGWQTGLRQTRNGWLSRRAFIRTVMRVEGLSRAEAEAAFESLLPPVVGRQQ